MNHQEALRVCDFIFELGVLKRLPRSGSFIAGVKNPDSIAEHIFRTSQLAFVLAELEGGSGERALFLASIHDNSEARIGDHHRLMSRYFETKEAELDAFKEQITSLPTLIAKKLLQRFSEFRDQDTIEAKAAKDADLLELAFESKQLLEQGYSGKKKWLEAIGQAIKTDSGLALFKALSEKTSDDWWQGLKQFPER
jgi:putative hydrolase of HD superfamily